MIMPKGEALLLPANPLFIWGSLLAALFVNLLPLGRTPWMPDLVLLLLLFWSLHQPLRVGIGAAFLAGLAMDVGHGALLGQHALAYSVLAFFAGMVQRRVQWLSLWEQTVQVAPLLLGAHAIELLVRLLAGDVFPGIVMVLAPAIETLLWPLASFLLLAPQRRPVDRDRNRVL